jgi:integrase
LTQRWHDREVISITADDLYGVVDEARRIGIPGLARRRNGLSNTQGRAMGAALSKMFAWLVEHRRITTNPALGMYKPPAPDARDRVLSGIEIRWFWQACDELGEPFGALLKLLLLTGCRRDEVADMTHGELSDGGSVWTIPGQRTKNGRPHVAYLPPLAREIIAGLPKVEGRAGFLFTTIGTRPVSGWSKIKLRLDALMLKAAKQDGAGITPWRLHDLRRTAVTGMGELGIRPDVVELVVNHLSGHRGGIAGIYNRSELMPERRAALERWSQHVVGIVSGEPGNIVRLKGR